MHFGIIEGLAESDNSDSAAGDQPGTVLLLSNISFKNERPGMFISRYRPMGVEWKCHNLSIKPLAEHNFEHNTLGFTGDARKHNTLFYKHNPTDLSRG